MAQSNNYLVAIPDLNRASKSEQGTFFILKESIVVMFFSLLDFEKRDWQ